MTISRVAVPLLLAVTIEVVGCALGTGVAAWTLIMAHILAIWAAWGGGTLIPKSWALASAFGGAGFGALFWWINWLFVGWLTVDVLGADSESGFIRFSGPYSLYLIPTALATAIAAGVGSFLSGRGKA